MKPGAGVHDVACGDVLAGFGSCCHRDDRLAGVDADPHHQGEHRIGRVELGDPVVDGEGRAQRALRIVLVRDRRAKQTDDRVADELLNRPADPLELPSKTPVVRREACPHVLGVRAVGCGRRADEVGVEDGDDLPLLARNERCAPRVETSAAGRTEDRVRLRTRAAYAAGALERGSAASAEPGTGLHFGSARGTRHRCENAKPNQPFGTDGCPACT